MNILILGAGGIGGYLGVRLALAGERVTFLVRPQRLAMLRDHGLRLTSPKGDAWLREVDAVDSLAGRHAHHDVAIIACKAWDLAAAIDAVRPAVDAGAMVLPVVNGVRHYDTLATAFGAARLIGGAAYASADVPRYGEIRHLNPFDKLVLGSWQPPQPPTGGRADAVAAALARALERAGVEVELSGDMQRDAWEKFTRVATLASLTCLFAAPVGEIVATDHGRALSLAMLDEAVAVASASGQAPRDAHLQVSRQRLTETGSALTASMMRDMLAGGRTEAEALTGDLVRRGLALGVPVPLLQVAWTRLQVHEQRWAASEGSAHRRPRA